MRRYTFYLSVALFAFGIGIVYLVFIFPLKYPHFRDCYSISRRKNLPLFPNQKNPNSFKKRH